tara:strand:- start:783 stop:974 length:192 start_codon:yes stop_codon:yes gene_type:complete
MKNTDSYYGLDRHFKKYYTNPKENVMLSELEKDLIHAALGLVNWGGRYISSSQRNLFAHDKSR